MSVSARTFQVISIVLQRAKDGELTTSKDISEFIAARRKNWPDTYSKAYISPSALSNLLDRLSVQEGLLMPLTGDNNCLLTLRGSQIANLLVDVDTCSTSFLDNYKEEVCRAALDYRRRYGQGPASAREVADLCNISPDSARRGLDALFDKDDLVDEDRSGRTTTYSFFDETTSGYTPHDVDHNSVGICVLDDDGIGGEEAHRKVARLLMGIDDEPLVPGDTPMTTPEDDESIIPLFVQDSETLVPLSLETPITAPEGVNMIPFRNDGEELQATDEEVEAAARRLLAPDPDVELVKVDPYAWETVDESVRHSVAVQAQACGMNLNRFLEVVVQANRTRMELALMHNTT